MTSLLLTSYSVVKRFPFSIRTEARIASIQFSHLMQLAQSLCHVQLFVTLWTAVGRLLCPWISRPEYWSGLTFPPPGIFPTDGLNLHLLHWQVASLPLIHLGSPIQCLSVVLEDLSRVIRQEKEI